MGIDIYMCKNMSGISKCRLEIVQFVKNVTLPRVEDREWGMGGRIGAVVACGSFCSPCCEENIF